MRRLFILTLSLITFTTFIAQPGAIGAKPLDINTTKLGLYLEENLDLNVGTASIYASSTPDVQKSFKICKSLIDEICLPATDIAINQFLELCNVQSDINCIEEIWALDKNMNRIQGVYLKHLPLKGMADFQAEPQMDLPASRGNSFLVRFPNLIHKGGNDEYLVGVRNSFWLRKQSGEDPRNFRVEVGNLIGAISAVQTIFTGQQAIQIFDGFAANGGLSTTPSGDRCRTTGDGFCAAARDFPPQIRLGMSLRLSTPLNGWFHGRISNPVIQTEKFPRSYRISIEAEPVRVAAVDFMVPTAEVDQRIKDRVFAGDSWGHAGNPQDGVKLVFSLSEDQAPNFLDLFAPNFKDTATDTSDFWTFKTLTDFRSDALRRCSDNSGDLAGIVTTNALLYSAGPPSFNAAEGSLDYRVAAPHFQSDGQEARGTYDLLLRSDVARCIYGFTNAPIRASLEVLTDGGSTKVATTSVSERDGWLSMSANGFSFSSPIVRAKLSQEASLPVTTPSPSPTPTVEATSKATPTVVKATKRTITCIKGEKKKRVQATKPKCPKGWKKA